MRAIAGRGASVEGPLHAVYLAAYAKTNPTAKHIEIAAEGQKTTRGAISAMSTFDSAARKVQAAKAK
jgi:hypothetical protein